MVVIVFRISAFLVLAVMLNGTAAVAMEPAHRGMSMVDLVSQVANRQAVTTPAAVPVRVSAAQSRPVVADYPPWRQSSIPRRPARAGSAVQSAPTGSQPAANRFAPKPAPQTVHKQSVADVRKAMRPVVSTSLGIKKNAVARVAEGSAPVSPKRGTIKASTLKPAVQAKAMFCVDCSANKVVLAKNVNEPLPIASITKLLTAMTVIDGMDLDQVVNVPEDIHDVPKHRVGLRPNDRLTVRDLLHGMLIESGNDCAEVLARNYPKGGRLAFIVQMNTRARDLGTKTMKLYTPSGLDDSVLLGRKDGRDLVQLRPNTASAEDVALVARRAFQYPLIRQISSMRTHTMVTRNTEPREYPLTSNDRLLFGNLPVAGAKTGYTNLAGRCIVALFKDQDREHMVVVLNTPKHFKAAEKIYRWACKEL